MANNSKRRKAFFKTARENLSMETRDADFSFEGFEIQIRFKMFWYTMTIRKNGYFSISREIHKLDCCRAAWDFISEGYRRAKALNQDSNV